MSLNLNCLTPRLTTGYLNTQDDPIPGLSAQGTTATSQQFLGMLGQQIQLTSAAALQLSYTTTGTLYGGTYQYVRFKAGTTAAPAVGVAVYWDDTDNYVVTPDVPTGQGGFAGVCIMANTKGNYGWIQTDGICTVLGKASSTTKTTPAVGDLLTLTASANTFDVLADATALTSPTAKLAVGVCIEALTAGGLKKAWIRHYARNF